MKISILSLFLLLLSICTELAAAQDPNCDEIANLWVESNAAVMVNNNENTRTKDAGIIEITQAGHYKISVKSTYNSGDLQKNESYYLTFVSGEGESVAPLNPNAGTFLVIPDTSGFTGKIWRPAGLYWFERGQYHVTMNHYYKIAADFPEFLIDNFDTPESVRVDSLHVVYTPRFDGSLSLQDTLFQTVEIKGVESKIVYPEVPFMLQAGIVNNSKDILRCVTYKQVFLNNEIIERIVPSLEPASQSGDTLIWYFPEILTDSTISIEMEVTLRRDIPMGYTNISVLGIMVVEDDVIPDNNRMTIPLHAANLPPTNKNDSNIDLAILLQSETIRGPGFPNSAYPGDSVNFVIAVSNKGPHAALTPKISAKLAPDFRFLNTTPISTSANRDSLHWILPELATNGIHYIHINGFVSPDITVADSILTTIASITSLQDTLMDNNLARNDIQILAEKKQPKISDVEISHMAVPRTGDTGPLTSIFSGEPYSYRIEMRVNGPDSAQGVQAVFSLPDFATFESATPEPDSIQGKSLKWNFHGLQAHSEHIIHIDVRADSNFATSPVVLKSTAHVSVENDSNQTNNQSEYEFTGSNRPAGFVDLAVAQTTSTIQGGVLEEQPVQVVAAGDLYKYNLEVFNNGTSAAQNVVIKNIIPQYVTLQDVEPASHSVQQDTILWRFSSLAAHSRLGFRVHLRVNQDLSAGVRFLINTIVAEATNEDPDNLGDNAASDTVYNIILLPPQKMPKIESYPKEVQVSDSISVRVQVPEEITAWRLIAIHENGLMDSTFSRSVTDLNHLQPDLWYDFPWIYKGARLTTSEKKEALIFKIKALTRKGHWISARSTTLVKSGNSLVLARNTFTRGDGSMAINFKLSSNRVARLDVFDLSGKRITKITEQPYNAGWNSYNWNGLDDKGQPVVSGVYLITIRSGDYRSWKKVIIIH